jgi:aryl-alcohol dehydrogenase-like predicted oxidoreductase
MGLRDQLWRPSILICAIPRKRFHATPNVCQSWTGYNGLAAVAAETGKTVPQVAITWLLQRPTVATVIIGARNEEQLRQNLEAVGWNLTSEQVAQLDAASATTPIYPYWHQKGFDERNPFPTA